jgi:hypothetical protein
VFDSLHKGLSNDETELRLLFRNFTDRTAHILLVGRYYLSFQRVYILKSNDGLFDSEDRVK